VPRHIPLRALPPFISRLTRSAGLRPNPSSTASITRSLRRTKLWWNRRSSCGSRPARLARRHRPRVSGETGYPRKSCVVLPRQPFAFRRIKKHFQKMLLVSPRSLPRRGSRITPAIAVSPTRLPRRMSVAILRICGIFSGSHPRGTGDMSEEKPEFKIKRTEYE